MKTVRWFNGSFAKVLFAMQNKLKKSLLKHVGNHRKAVGDLKITSDYFSERIAKFVEDKMVTNHYLRY